MTATRWYNDAACAGSDVELFYSEHPADIRSALQLCQGCPVRQPCLDAAMDDREPFGVWGGTDGAARRRIFRRQDRLRRRQSAAA